MANFKAKQGNQPTNKSGKGFKPSMKGKQGRKDSSDKRVNFDNTRASKFARDVEKDIEKGSKMSSANDISTWNSSPTFLKNACSYTFASILGDRITPNSLAVPGILSFIYTPALGASDDPIAFNKAFQALYSEEVEKNSRTYKYDYPDVAMYITAGNEVFAALAEPMRIYGLYKSYTEPNRYLVDGLVRSLGWDPENFRRHLSIIKYDLNDLIMQTRSIWLPNNIPVLKRWIDMNLHVYTDAPGSRSQMYAFVRGKYWKLSETGSNQGTSLVPATYNTSATYEFNTPAAAAASYTEFDRVLQPTINASNNITWPQYRSMVQDMINRLQASGDRAAIYGDLRNALGDSGIYAMPEFKDDFVVTPEYNAEVLMQIENIEVSRYVQRFVVQVQNAPGSDLRMAPLWQTIGRKTSGGAAQWVNPVPSSSTSYASLTQNMGPTDKHLLNFHIPDQPSPEAIMVATRFKCGALAWTTNYIVGDNASLSSSTGDWGSYFTIPAGQNPEAKDMVAPTSCSTEIINAVVMGIYNASKVFVKREVVMYDSNEPLADDIPGSTGMLMAFDWHPFYTYYTDNWEISFPDTPVSIYANAFNYALGDYDNYTLMDDINLANIHHVALYSAFGVKL